MKKKILIIDDEPQLVQMIANRLRASGYDTVTAVKGEEGIGRARQEKMDLIILDIRMPDLDGYEVLEKLKSFPETQKVPVIMLTVKKWSEDVEKAISAGARDYLAKPFEPRVLLEKIKEALA